MSTKEHIKTLVKEELKAYKSGYFYAEHELYESGEYLKLIDRVLRKSRLSVIFAIPLIIVAFIAAGYYLMLYAESDAVTELIISLSYSAFGLFFLVFITRNHFRTTSALRILRRLLVDDRSE